jgi:hypothetical protein
MGVTMSSKQTSRAESLLPEVLPDVIALLNGAPDFGTCGIDVTFHEGRIARIVTKTESSRKPGEKTGGR